MASRIAEETKKYNRIERKSKSEREIRRQWTPTLSLFDEWKAQGLNHCWLFALSTLCYELFSFSLLMTKRRDDDGAPIAEDRRLLSRKFSRIFKFFAKVSSSRLFHVSYDLRGRYNEKLLSNPCFKKGQVIRRVVAKN